MKLIIKNGVLVTPDKTEKADILISGGVIEAIAENIVADGAEIINAGGMHVMAGGVDVHTHLNLTLGERHVSDGFYAGTLAAAHGGTTTIVDHPEAGPAGCSLFHQPEYYKKLLRSEAVIDYGVHGVFQSADEWVISQVEELILNGIPSAKVYTTYDNMLGYADIYKVIKEMSRHGGLTAFHAEDDRVIKNLRLRYGEEGKLEPIYHARSRPETSEADAVKRILETAGGAPVYIVHLSTAKGLQVIREAKKAGQKVFAETCPQYLILDESCYEKPDGVKYIMAPPLRTKDNCEALWDGIADGSIDTVATDHCSFSFEDKIRFGKGDFRLCPGGAPGVETRLPLLYSEGVLKGRISISRFTELVSDAPARIMGLESKGRLAEGMDADIIIWNSRETKRISPETLHQKCDYSPYDGMHVTGWPVTTLLRGEIIIDKGRFTGTKGAGRFQHRRGIL